MVETLHRECDSPCANIRGLPVTDETGPGHQIG
jgi:hypothetical protein